MPTKLRRREIWLENVCEFGYAVSQSCATYSNDATTCFALLQVYRVEPYLIPEYIRVTSSPFVSEQRYAEMLGATNAKFAAVSKDLVFLYANNAFAKQWDKTPDELIGKPVKEILGADGFHESKDHFANAINGHAVEYEAEFSVGFRTFDLATRLVPFFDSDQDSATFGQSEGFYVFTRYVTAKRVSQQALSLILASAPGTICLINRDCEITYANRRFQEEYGRDHELKGVNFAEAIGSQMWQRAKPNFEQALNGNSTRHREVVGDNQSIVYLIPDHAKERQNVVGVYCLIFDETELEMGRQRLRRRERNVELALQGQMVGIWEADPNREDWLLTEHIETLLGLPAGGLENSRSLTFDRIHPDDLPAMLRDLQLTHHRDSVYVHEFRIKDHTGQYRWLRGIGQPELDNEGNVIYVAGTIGDVNELKEAELLAAEQVKHRDSFLSMLSHELRNPVAAIKYALDIFQHSSGEPIELPEVHQNSIGIISRQTNIISRMLKDLLNVNRISSNEILFEEAAVDLVKLLREIAEVSLPRFAQKRQRLKFECDTDTFIISGDAVRLHQVFINILDNASKYSPENTEVTLGCHIDTNSGDFVTLVSDQGRGIKPESRRSIFELFSQEDPSLDRAEGGLGIGLYLVKKIVEAHRGQVNVVSPGKNGGSDFEVRLRDKKPEQKAVSNEPATSSLRKLVLVEDNDDSRVALTLVLSARDFEVEAFADGETAAKGLPPLSPDVALIDIGLPRMDGMALMKELRQHEELKDTLFIALTGYSQDHERAAIMKSGFDYHLVKPLDLNDLFEIIAKHAVS